MRTQVKHLLIAKPVLPGTLEKYYNVCGKAGCRCKDKNNPRKHGPYYRLSYSIKGKNSCIFVRKEDVKAIKEMTGNYKNLRSNTLELSLEMLEIYREKGLKKALAQYKKLIDQESRKKISAKPEAAVLRSTRISRDSWKNKALERQEILIKNRVKTRDIEKSRDQWKSKAIEAQEKIKKVQKELTETKQRLGKLEEAISHNKQTQEAKKK